LIGHYNPQHDEQASQPFPESKCEHITKQINSIKAPLEPELGLLTLASAVCLCGGVEALLQFWGDPQA
jgi:hypothetical protein